MKQPARRKILKGSSAVLVAGIAGCSSDDGNDTENDSSGSTASSPPIEQYLKISEVEWTSYLLRFRVEKISNTDLDFVDIESAVYDGDTRLGTTSTYIGELAAGINVNAEIDYSLANLSGNLCDGTRYTLTPSFDVGGESYEQTYDRTDPPVCGLE